MKIIDLSMPINMKTPVYPGDPKQSIKQFATIKSHGWNEKRLTINSHFGTHIDAPFHMRKDGKKLSDFIIESFVGNAVVIDARDIWKRNPDLSKIKNEKIVFFYTGHVKKAYSKEYFKNNPVISVETAKELIKKKVSIVGIDSYTPDNYPFVTHKTLFQKNIRIVENLVNLDKLVGKKFLCHILPMNITDADGAPCRVIATINGKR